MTNAGRLRCRTRVLTSSRTVATLAQLDEIDWEAVQAMRWAEMLHLKEGKQAEFLMETTSLGTWSNESACIHRESISK